MHGDIDIANFTDDNTPYTSARNIDDVTEFLEQVQVVWTTLLKGNAKKFHFLTSTDQEVSLNVDNFTIKNSEYINLGIKLDNNKYNQKLPHF